MVQKSGTRLSQCLGPSGRRRALSPLFTPLFFLTLMKSKQYLPSDSNARSASSSEDLRQHCNKFRKNCSLGLCSIRSSIPIFQLHVLQPTRYFPSKIGSIDLLHLILSFGCGAFYLIPQKSYSKRKMTAVCPESIDSSNPSKFVLFGSVIVQRHVRM